MQSTAPARIGRHHSRGVPRIPMRFEDQGVRSGPAFCTDRHPCLGNRVGPLSIRSGQGSSFWKDAIRRNHLVLSERVAGFVPWPVGAGIG